MTKLIFAFCVAMGMVATTTDSYGNDPLIVAHRGASFDAPENTLASFRLAWEFGADAIEGDFYLTADDRIVCIHDSNTLRTTSADLEVEQSTLAQLRRLDAGSWKHADFTGEKIPTIEEVLKCVPAGKTLVIELKSQEKIVEPLARALEAAGRDDIQLMIISFDAATAKECVQRLPEIPVHWLTSFKEEVPGGGYRPTAGFILKTVHDLGVDGVGINGNKPCIDDDFMREMNSKRSADFHVWTIDDPQVARRFAKLGAFAITTNRPDVIRQALQPAAVLQ